MTPEQFVDDMLAHYGAAEFDPAHELCDRHDPDAIALRVVDGHGACRDVSFGALRLHSEAIAAGLGALGVGPGGRVATYLERGAALTEVVLAIHRRGATHVPLFTAFGPNAVADRLRTSGTSVLVTDEENAAKLHDADLPATVSVVVEGTTPAKPWIGLADLRRLAPAPPVVRDPAVPMVLMHTSGTTGTPKAVPMPAEFLAAWRVYFRYGLDLRDSDVFWCHADPGWTLGLYAGLLAPLALGIPAIALRGRFHAEGVARVLREHRVTNFVSAPTVYRSLQATTLTSGRPAGLRCASSAGEPLTPDVDAWSPAALGVLVHDHYGQTELGMVVNDHHHPRLPSARSRGTMGHPMPGWRLEVVDEHFDPSPADTTGRLVVDVERSPLMWFRGYEAAAEASAQRFSPDGRWYVTGDLACRGLDGEFRFASREDDVIIMAGYRIGPFDVESAIRSHPAVAECGVVAVPDVRLGEAIEAFVVLSPDALGTAALAEEIQGHVRRHYAAHAYPRRVHFIDSLPKTPSGKLQRSQLRLLTASEETR